MTSDSRDFGYIRISVLSLSAVSWGLLLAGPSSGHMMPHCAPDFTATAYGSAPLSLLRALGRSASLAAGWAWVLMLVAMMSPLLVPPMRHVYISSFAHRRARSIALFVAGYWIVWVAIGVAFLPVEFAAGLLAPKSYFPAAVIALVALVWQCSPLKQFCLNRCCSHVALSAFGGAADFDAVRFGLRYGAWCTGSCWALMFFPMLLPKGHLLAMALIAGLLFCERLEGPMPPSWRVRGLGRVSRSVLAQVRMHLAAN